MIYFVQIPMTGPIKIGTTTVLSRRLSALCKDTGLPLHLLGVMDGGRDEERDLHRRFSHLRITGEWFSAEESLLNFIQAVADEWDGNDESSMKSIALIKGTDSVDDWLASLAKHVKLQNRTGMIWQAIEEYAEAHGYTIPLPR